MALQKRRRNSLQRKLRRKPNKSQKATFQRRLPMKLRKMITPKINLQKRLPKRPSQQQKAMILLQLPTAKLLRMIRRMSRKGMRRTMSSQKRKRRVLRLPQMALRQEEMKAQTTVCAWILYGLQPANFI